MLRFRSPYFTLLWLGWFAVLPARGEDAVVHQCQPGPWGHIEYQMIWLEPPERLADQSPLPTAEPRWCFPGGTATSVRALLNQAHLDDALINRLLQDPRAQPDQAGMLTINPTPADVESLAPAARAAIYLELAKYPINEFFHNPITIAGQDVDGWLHTSDLPAPMAALARKMIYHDGDVLLFSDIRTILSHAKNEKEARQWVRALNRVRAVTARLRLDDAQNLPELERYWSANFRRKDVLPILDGAAQMPAGYQLDLLHLLPPLPRSLANSYPTPNLERMGETPNSHWTSLNFFNYTPQNIAVNLKFAATKVLENYVPVQEPYALGDILFFINAQGAAFQSCSYIADNLVFSKDGANDLRPWMLTTLEDIKTVYLRAPGTKILAFRRQWSEETPVK